MTHNEYMYLLENYKYLDKEQQEEIDKIDIRTLHSEEKACERIK